MKKEFTKADLKAGYVLKIKYHYKEIFAIVCENADGEMAVSSEDFWCQLSSFDEDFTHGVAKIISVYGLSYSNMNAYKISCIDREILWERDAKLKITYADIAKKFNVKPGGFKIVEEDIL